jgi:hypothetical protein
MSLLKRHIEYGILLNYLLFYYAPPFLLSSMKMMNIYLWNFHCHDSCSGLKSFS